MENFHDSESVEPAVDQNVTAVKHSSKKIIILVLLLILIPLVAFMLRKQPTPLTQAPSANPTPTQEALLAHKAKQDMPIFLNSLLQPAYIPQPQDASNVKVSTNNKRAVIDKNRFFVSMTLLSDVTLYASIRYQNQTQMDRRALTLRIPSFVNTLSSTSAAQDILKYISVKPAGAWKCQIINQNGNTSTICENFWQVKNLVKMGVGIINPEVGQKLDATAKSVVFFCEMYKNGNSFNEKSCTTYFKNTGIGN